MTTTLIAGETGRSVSAEEIALRMKQGKRINEEFERVYQSLLATNAVPEPEAKRRANAAAYQEACRLFRQIPGFEDLDPTRDKKTLDAMMYDRKKVAGQLADFDIQDLSMFPWAALQALGTDLISRERKQKILRLAEHYKKHSGCPNSIKPVILNFRHYCHQPDDEKMAEIDMKYARLMEELGETLEPDDIMRVQTKRDEEITARYEGIVEEKMEEEEVPAEDVVQEVPQEASKSEAIFPVLQEPAQEPVIETPVTPQPAPVATPETSHYASAMTSFQGIIKTQSDLIGQLQHQVATLMELVANAEQKEQQKHKQLTDDYHYAMQQWESTEARLLNLESEFEEYKASHTIPNSGYEAMKQALSDLSNIRERITTALGI